MSGDLHPKASPPKKIASPRSSAPRNPLSVLTMFNAVAVGFVFFAMFMLRDQFPHDANVPDQSTESASVSESWEIAPVETRVPDEINTSALMDCWMNSIRDARNWMHTGDRTGDVLARFYGKGGIAVTVVVIGNRIDLNQLALAGLTGSGTEAVLADAFGVEGGLSYWDAQDIYGTAVRAITRCGIADVPLQNGKFYFVFVPDKESIPVVKLDQ